MSTFSLICLSTVLKKVWMTPGVYSVPNSLVFVCRYFENLMMMIYIIKKCKYTASPPPQLDSFEKCWPKILFSPPPPEDEGQTQYPDHWLTGWWWSCRRPCLELMCTLSDPCTGLVAWNYWNNSKDFGLCFYMGQHLKKWPMTVCHWQDDDGN